MMDILRRGVRQAGILIVLGALMLHSGSTRLHQSLLASVNSQPSFLWPIDGAPDPPYLVGDAFGPRLNNGVYDWHRGIDIKGEKCSTKVLASTSGYVRISSDSDDRYENCGRIIQVQYPNSSRLEYRTNYCHLCERRVAEGDYVEQGAVIGLVGEDKASWSHLHFEIRDRDDAQNPYCYLPHPERNDFRIEITDIVTSSLPTSLDLSLRVTTPREELDINQVRVRVLALDGQGGEIDKYVDFNENHNCGTDEPCTPDGSICIDPQHFWHDIPEWDVGFDFSGLQASGLVMVVAEAKDCDGTVRSDTWNNLPEKIYVPTVFRLYE
jgi:hypothetical protein